MFTKRIKNLISYINVRSKSWIESLMFKIIKTVYICIRKCIVNMFGIYAQGTSWQIHMIKLWVKKSVEQILLWPFLF